MEVKHSPTELLNKNTDPGSVWVYVNPLTGKHIKTTNTKRLAVFSTKESAHSWENLSFTLQNNICYEVSWDDMISIANKEAGGNYVIL
jgi:hypothetical protein